MTIINLRDFYYWYTQDEYKDPKDKQQLIVDADAAEIVKRVYSMLLQGSSKRAIALYLNKYGIPSPTAYCRKNGLPISSAVADDPMWGVSQTL